MKVDDGRSVGQEWWCVLPCALDSTWAAVTCPGVQGLRRARALPVISLISSLGPNHPRAFCLLHRGAPRSAVPLPLPSQLPLRQAFGGE